MPNANSVIWFKANFEATVTQAVQGTLFSSDMITAIACQETGYIWDILRRHLSVDEVLELCVGDSLDYNPGSNRSRSATAFPKNKADLLTKPRGRDMFDIARKSLVDMAEYIPGYQGAVANPDKFCHGFGIFQYDIQFFMPDPDYFLNRSWGDFSQCLAKCIQELRFAQRAARLDNKTVLTKLEMCYVAIAYNTGRFNPARGLRQGFNDGKYYGERIFDFITLSEQINNIPQSIPIAPPQAGHAILPPASPLTAEGTIYEVETLANPLRLRATPDLAANGDPTGKVIGRISDGQLVRLLATGKTNGFYEVETSLQGALMRGWASATFLKKAPTTAVIAVESPIPVPLFTGIPPVYAPRKAGSVTSRANPATAQSLNENGQPGRFGTTPQELASELIAIVEWLKVDHSSHTRYQPANQKTYCNIYAHDYCHLAGIYLPRVWWSQASIIRLKNGEQVEPKLGTTIDEMRANDLFRWLRDFGLNYGWRRTGTLTKLQQEVNMGAVGMIVARRKDEGRSGHIVAVVPEAGNHTARRSAAGEVIAPLQSQAGSVNFRYGTSTLNWWNHERFAESAFWLHA